MTRSLRTLAVMCGICFAMAAAAGQKDSTPARLPTSTGSVITFNRDIAPNIVPGWRLGQPDQIIEADKPFALPASGSDIYWNFIFRTPVDRTRWLKAIEIRLGDKRVVHHANILVDRGQSARRQETQPG